METKQSPSIFTKLLKKVLDLPNRKFRKLRNESQRDTVARINEANSHYYTAILQQRTLPWAARRKVADKGSVPSPYSSDYLQRGMEKINSLAPRALELWHACQAAGDSVYRDDPQNNCAVDGHRNADNFRSFMAPYLAGNVLDIGCGPQTIPSYLADHPVKLMAGIDPLGKAEDHPFTFSRAIAELLPWDNHTFDTVVVATSLDHVILLDQAFSEMRRVLRPDGYLLAWLGFLPGSPRFNPYQEDLKPVDKFHLFHFDRGWFEEELNKHFEIVEVFEFYHPKYRAALDCYYALKPRLG